MQESLYQTGDAEVSLSDSACRSLSIRERTQKTLYQTADADVSFIRQRMQMSLFQTADAGVFL